MFLFFRVLRTEQMAFLTNKNFVVFFNRETLVKLGIWVLSVKTLTEHDNSKGLPIKVRQSRNDFFKPMFRPKNKRTNSTLLL